MEGNSRRGRESCVSEAHDLEMADSSMEVRGFPVGDGVGVEESVNSLHRTWEPLSPTASPVTPSSSSGLHMGYSDESRPLLSRHARQIEERRQGEAATGTCSPAVDARPLLLMCHLSMSNVLTCYYRYAY